MATATLAPAALLATKQAADEKIDALLSPKEAASHIGVREPTLAVWRSSGRYNLAFIKVGRLVRYRRSVFDAFLEANTATQTR